MSIGQILEAQLPPCGDELRLLQDGILVDGDLQFDAIPATS
jgi:hypothetical protein